MEQVIGFEPICGDQSLFDGADQQHLVAVRYWSHGEITGTVTRYFKSTRDAFVFAGSTADFAVANNDYAERRPVVRRSWTRAEQLAGGLPAPGSLIRVDNGEAIFRGVNIGNHHEWHVEHPSGDFELVPEQHCGPIETEMERLDRLSAEWAIQAGDMIDEEAGDAGTIPTVLLRKMYRWMAAGELKLPETKKEKNHE